MNAESKEQLLQTFRKNQKVSCESAVFNKAFLKPFQAVLKTAQTENKPSKIGCLPFGLKQVIWKSIDGNKHSLKGFPSFSSLQLSKMGRFNNVSQNYCDNFISLLKEEKKNPLKLAICIAMYNEERILLQRTLQGVKKNIAELSNQGYCTDEVAVFVLMDGVEHVHSSIDQLFQKLQHENDIVFSNSATQNEIQEILDQREEGSRLKEDDINDNAVHILFHEDQLEKRRTGRFITRKNEYFQIKKLIKELSQLQKLNKKNIIDFQSVNERIQNMFFQEARQYHKKQYAEDDYQVKKHNRDFYRNEYVEKNENKNIFKIIFQKTLINAKKDCEVYFKTRESMAIVNPFRVEVDMKKYGFIQEQDDQFYNDQSEQDFKRRRNNKVFMNLFMVTKYANGGKLSSHNWFFNGFCRELSAEYAIILDVGLIPEGTALVKMVNHMEKHEKVGGVCGYMGIRPEMIEDHEQIDDQDAGCFASLFMKLFDVQRTQQLEYHYSHLIDKPFEAIFKFVHVLPGAFSGYRLKALQQKKRIDNNENNQESELKINKDDEDFEDSEILQEYFKSLNPSEKEIKATDYSTGKAILRVILPDFLFFCCYPKSDEVTEEQQLANKNVFLAEDRTLCMGIHINGYDLEYLPDAYSEVDPMKTLAGLLGQRKRWINGSFFAFEQVKETFEKNKQENNCFLYFQMSYLALMNKFAYIAPALFLFTIHLAMIGLKSTVYNTLFTYETIESQRCESNTFQAILMNTWTIPSFVYIILFLSMVFFSMHLTNKNKRFLSFIYFMSAIIGFISMIIFILLLVDIFRGSLLSFDENNYTPQKIEDCCEDPSLGICEKIPNFQIYCSSFFVDYTFLQAFNRDQCLTNCQNRCSKQYQKDCKAKLKTCNDSCSNSCKDSVLNKVVDIVDPNTIRIISQILLYFVLTIFVMHFLPIMAYALLYCRYEHICQILISLPSFLFYTPTYLILLNIYAISRIDDISWGTKGLDKENHMEVKKKQAWKKIRMIQICKFLYWNALVGTVLLLVSGSDPQSAGSDKQRYIFYMSSMFFTLIIMFFLILGLILKTVLGIIYMIIYKCKSAKPGNHDRDQDDDEEMIQGKVFSNKNRIWKKFDILKQSIYDEIQNFFDKAIQLQRQVERKQMRTVSLIQIIPQTRKPQRIFRKKKQAKKLLENKNNLEERERKSIMKSQLRSMEEIEQEKKNRIKIFSKYRPSEEEQINEQANQDISAIEVEQINSTVSPQQYLSFRREKSIINKDKK